MSIIYNYCTLKLEQFYFSGVRHEEEEYMYYWFEREFFLQVMDEDIITHFQSIKDHKVILQFVRFLSFVIFYPLYILDFAMVNNFSFYMLNSTKL